MDSFNRRNFLKTAGAVAAGSALADVPAAAVPFPLISVDMLAEGILNGILATSLPTLPPNLEGRVRYKSPSSINGGKLRRDLLEVHVFAWPAVAELPLAIPPTPLPISQGGPTISLFYVEINDIRLAKNPQYYPWGINSLLELDYDLLLIGKGVAHPIIANPTNFGPFGDLVGRPMAIGAALDRLGNNVIFQMLGGMAAGDHVTMSIGRPDTLRPLGTALGSLKLDLLRWLR